MSSKIVIIINTVKVQQNAVLYC